MQFKTLQIAAAVALAGVGITSAGAAPLGAVDPSPVRNGVDAGLALPLPFHDQVGLVSLDALPGMFDRGGVQAATRMAKLPGASGSVLSKLENRALQGDMVGWVWAGALADPAVREEAGRMYESGLPLLVLNGTGITDASQAATAIVGLTTNAPVAMYIHDKAGNVRSFSIDADLSSTQSLEKAISVVAGQTREAIRTQRVVLADDVEPIALPRVTMIDTATDPRGSGSSVTQEVNVIRDSTISRDQYVVIAKSRWNVIPNNNGLSGGALTIPGSYRLDQTLIVDSEGTPVLLPSLASQYPASNGSTDISFTDTQRTTTSYGFNISRDMSGGLQGMVPEASAKTSFGFTFGREYVDEQSINFSVRDYSVAAAASSPTLGSRATWNLNLAAAISSNAGYFGGSPSLARVTPMMRQASAETFARWVLSARHPGGMRIIAQANVSNLRFTGSSIGSVGDTWAQPNSVINVPSRLPYLSRETTVLIQSQAGGGSCLSDSFGSLQLVSCPGPTSWLNTRVAHWRLDAEGRYVNGQTGNCLQFDTSSGDATVGSCSLALNQRWEWRADRIYTLFNSAADDWRLHVVNGRARVVTDPAVYQDLPTNHNQILLNPWSNYPAAPVRGVTVPNIGAGSTQSPIPEDWLRFRAIRPEETWRVIPIRANI
ncbi:RICIN domain-containing protein [Pinirhizobacter soli]|uniref:RICIN domain-containing protein n=1 Tax=Pinirhizobacter soli TaxID=2786953 RepID=UPI002029E5A3|nr:RICIN domain-containing protein [Pinirhizobacter soli]